MTDGQMILGGLMMLVVAFLLRRSFSQSQASRRRDPLREAKAEIREAESRYAASINKLELRLHDYAREVEGRIETKLAMLDRLLVEADHKLDRWEAMASETQGGSSRQHSASPDAGSLDSSDEQLKIYRLADDGLSVEEIADRTRQPSSHVRLILKMRRDSRDWDAA